MKNISSSLLTSTLFFLSSTVGFGQTTAAAEEKCKPATFLPAGSTNVCTREDITSNATGVNGLTKAVAVPVVVKQDKSYTAFIDNEVFPCKAFQPVCGMLVEPPFMDDANGARTTVNFVIGETSDTGKMEDGGRESIRIQLTLMEPVTPGPVNCRIYLYHQSGVYTMVKSEEGSVDITDFIWSMDRKSFILSLNYRGTMRSINYPNDGKKDIQLKGKLARVHVIATGPVSASE